MKTVADFYSPLAGRILEININLDELPDVVNTDPYDTGWIMKLDSLNKDRYSLLSAHEYEKLIK